MDQARPLGGIEELQAVARSWALQDVGWNLSQETNRRDLCARDEEKLFWWRVTQRKRAGVPWDRLCGLSQISAFKSGRMTQSNSIPLAE